MNTVLEGFYGLAWSWPQRRFLIELLASAKAGDVFSAANNNAEHSFYGQYCYAPKSDAYIRNDWLKPWPQASFNHLRELSLFAQSKNIGFSVGLSPVGLFELWLNDEALARHHLTVKLQELSQLSLSSLGLFFDDMPASDTRIASVQSQICHFVCSLAPTMKVYFCPSYYSYDPVLPALFGDMPENYWADLGRLLPADVEVFWTGDKVISTSYSAESLKHIVQLLQRPVTIWDNSCVNDGRLTSDFLPLKACSSLAELDQNTHIAGFWLNPSNAFYVAVLTVASSLLDEGEGDRFEMVLDSFPLVFSRFVRQYKHVFVEGGLSGLSRAETSGIRSELDVLKLNKSFLNIELEGEFNVDSLVSGLLFDIETWLDSGFKFDEACLT